MRDDDDDDNDHDARCHARATIVRVGVRRPRGRLARDFRTGARLKNRIPHNATPNDDMASPRAAYSPENVRSNALFDDDDYLDAIATPASAKPTPSSSTFSFESLKDPRIDWAAIAACDSREARRSTDIDALEGVLEACVRADVDSVTNQDMCEPKRGRELTKLLQMLVEYLLHVQEALSEGKERAIRESEGWRERARRERDGCRKVSRELRLAVEAHEAELIAVAAEYAKKRNNPDSAELEDARRRGESIAAERAARDLEKRLREQRELFDGAVDRMRAAHAEAQAEAARELSARKAELAAARAQYVASSADSTKEANRMVSDAQALIREAREKAELEKSNSSRMRAELNAAVEAQQRHKRALLDVKMELSRLREDFKFESESNAELRKALERRDEERNIMREQIETLHGKQSSTLTEEMAELTSMRELAKNNYAEIERLKRENEVLRADKNSKSTWVEEEKKKWVSANEQILQDEVSERDGEITRLVQEVARLRKELEIERSRKMVTIKPIIDEMEARAVIPPSTRPELTRPPTVAPTPEREVEAMPPPSRSRKASQAAPRKVEDMDTALTAMMVDLNVDVQSEGGLSDAAFEAAMKTFEATKMRDVPKELRAKYKESSAQIQRQIENVTRVR